MTVFEKIEAQQAQAEQYSPQWGVGEQLKDICRAEPKSAELIAEDIDTVTIFAVEKQIKAWADAHQTGYGAFVPPPVADEIIRKAYGLPPREEAPTAPTEIDFDSFL